jgi:hypothetical protein
VVAAIVMMPGASCEAQTQTAQCCNSKCQLSKD